MFAVHVNDNGCADYFGEFGSGFFLYEDEGFQNVFFLNNYVHRPVPDRIIVDLNIK
jgi:hypothetical protein